MEKTATVLKKTIKNTRIPGYAEAWHCKVTPPVTYSKWSEDDETHTSDYVIVSAVNNSMVFETYIFPADEEGDIVDWGELDGSQKETVDHEMVLEDAGYRVVMLEVTEPTTGG